MDIAEVEKIAQGRVWNGIDAAEIGLVNEVGGLEDALTKAAEMAGLDEYRTTEYPAVKDPIQLIMEELTGQEVAFKNKILEGRIGQLLY